MKTGVENVSILRFNHLRSVPFIPMPLIFCFDFLISFDVRCLYHVSLM